MKIEPRIIHVQKNIRFDMYKITISKILIILRKASVHNKHLHGLFHMKDVFSEVLTVNVK